jgi:TolB-like protein
MKTTSIAVAFAVLSAVFAGAEDKQIVVAVLDAVIPQNMNKQVGTAIAETVSEQLRATDKLTVVDRTTISRSLEELELQMSGVADEGEIKKAGKFLGASHIVIIQVSNPGITYFITMKMVDVESGVIIAQESGQDMGMDSIVLEIAERVGKKLAADVTGGEIFGDVLRLSLDAGFSDLIFFTDLPPEATFHDTHPDDSFMLAFGSPGTTPLDAASMGFIDIGASCGIRTRDRKTLFTLDYIFKLPVIVAGRNMHQNDNDPRSPEIGAYVYTQILNGFMPSHELSVGIRRFIGGNAYVYFTAGGGFWDMRFETGWYRWSSDQTQSSFFARGPGLGFTGGIAFNLLPKTVFRLDIAYKLAWLTYYDYPAIPIKMPQGVQIGGSVEYILF